MNKELKHIFEAEVGEGIYNNEGKETVENNGSYNDSYVIWLENKLKTLLKI